MQKKIFNFFLIILILHSYNSFADTKLNVNRFEQKYQFSCETAALRMVLKYHGLNISEDTIISKMPFDKTKLEWQNDNKFDLFSNVAASVQEHFEESQIARSYFLKNKYPHFENLIITGGCALNCTTNMKIYDKAIFNSIYIPPFPGDECISLGAASFLYHNIHNQTWQPCSYDHQHSYFGKKSSVPTDSEILSCFNQFNIHKPANIAAYAAEKISDGKIIAWFQGRSETGPRSLGNRSILARADKKGIKEYLNNNIKFRETFRPYGSSVLFEKSHEYFEVPQGFENPFMSFATKTLSNFKELLKDVTHVDGTSRMQTVRESQNLLFYNLIKHVGAKTGLYCVLNTSLNIMGEPVIETVEDAKRFLICSEVDGLAIGPFYITKNLL